MEVFQKGRLVGENAVTKDHGPSVGGSTMDLRFVEASGVKSMQLSVFLMAENPFFLLNQWGGTSNKLLKNVAAPT